MLKLRTLMAVLLCLCSGWALASPEQQIRERLLQLQPDLGIETVNAVAGQELYEVRLSGGRFVYANPSASFLLAGELFTLNAEGEALNHTEVSRQAMTAELLAGLDANSMVIFPAANKRASISVFTDVDCGYCRKLHQEVPALNSAGIEVRYLAWPRGGLGNATYQRMVSLWCADDPAQAMTQAKSGQSIASRSCKHPIDQQLALGQLLGLRGTPAIVLDNGALIPGYVPAQQLIAQVLAAQ